MQPRASPAKVIVQSSRGDGSRLFAVDASTSCTIADVKRMLCLSHHGFCSDASHLVLVLKGCIVHDDTAVSTLVEGVVMTAVTLVSSPHPQIQAVDQSTWRRVLTALFDGLRDSDGRSYPDHAVADAIDAILSARIVSVCGDGASVPRNHPKFFGEVAIACSLASVASRNMCDGGNLIRGELCARLSFNEFNRLYGPDHSDTLSCLTSLGFFLVQRQHVAEADRCFETCLQGRARTLGSDHNDTHDIRCKLMKLRESKINYATQWLDEDCRTCPKDVNYATQCPKGHPLLPYAGGGGGAAQPAGVEKKLQGDATLICRVCHRCTAPLHAQLWLACSVAGCCGGYAVCEACVGAVGCAPVVGAVDDEFPSVGVCVAYLLWIKATFGPSLGRLTTEQVCQMYIKPRSCRSRSSIAHELVSQEKTRYHVGEATWFISHTWSNAFADTLDAVLLFFEGRQDAASAFLWLDFLVTPQHASAGPSKPSSWWMGTFKSSIARIGSLLLVVDAWDNPTPLKRAWCVLEIHAIAMKKATGGGGNFAVAMTAQEKRRFRDCMECDANAYTKMLGTVNLEASGCSRPEDRSSIHQGIRDSVGFRELGRMVLGVMNEWVTQELRANLNQNDVVEEMLRNSSLNCVLLDQGRYNDAVVCGERALECAKLVLGKRDPELGVYMSHLADAYLHAGRCKEALDLYESCLELETGLLAEGDRRTGFTMNGLSMVYLKIGRLDDALRMCQRALDFRRRFLPPSHPDLLDSMSNLATVYSKLNRDAEALIMHESAVEFALQHLPPSHPNTAAAMRGLGLRYYALGRHSDALRLFESAFEIEQQVLPPDHPVLHRTMQCLAETYRSLSRHSDELTMCKAILEFRQKFLGQGIPELASLNHRVHGLQIAIQDTAAHADSVRHMQDAGSVVITRHRGGGYASPDYSLHFRDDFDTFVADIMLCGGCFYWEIEVVEMPAQNQVFQFGVCTDGFEARQIPDGEGAGDDAKSWAVDGTRQLMWHKGRVGPYGSSWRFGDVIGFALDMRTSGAAVLSVSVNGSFASPNGAAFTSIDAPYLSPAFSGARGRCLLNLGSRPFVHAVNAEYTSVLAFHRKQQQ